MKETHENDYVRQTLREAMPDDLPSAVRQQMLNRLAAFPVHRNQRLPVAAFSSIASIFRRKSVGWAMAAAAILAAAVLLVSQSWRPAQSSAWAAVVEAVAKKPWLHVVTTYPDGTIVEHWFSARRSILAQRTIKGRSSYSLWDDREGRVLHDFARNTREDYDPKNDKIVRTIDYPDDKDRFEAIYSAFLSGNPAQTFQFGPSRFVPKGQRLVTEGDKRWIEYRLKRERMDEPAALKEFTWIVLVDPNNQLPFRWEQTRHFTFNPSKVNVSARSDIDYPASGPEDLYALGAPKTATLVDRTLPASVKKLAEATVAPKHWAHDKFSTIVIESGPEKQQWWQGFTAYRVWKEGLRWRVDRSMGPLTEPSDKAPPKGTNPAEWWREKVKRLPFIPASMCDGTSYWTYDAKTRPPTAADKAAGWPEHTMVIVSINKRQYPSVPVAKDRFHLPDPLYFGGHPTDLRRDLRILPGFMTSLDAKPKSGPPNSVLLEVRNPVWRPSNPSDLDGLHTNPQIWRFWIDPARDHLVMRRDILITHQGKEVVIGGTAIEELTHDVRGRWYPIVVRIINRNLIGTDKWEDGILRFYYDFTTSIPESVFQAD
jgi:hypothetical protein